jgi:hypothetical protein
MIGGTDVLLGRHQAFAQLADRRASRGDRARNRGGVFPGLHLLDGQNVPVSLFLSNARPGMLPIRMWGMMESTLDVRIASIAGVLILATLVLVIVMDWLTGLTKRTSVQNPEPHDLPRPGDWP